MSKLSYKADIMIVLNHILYLRLWFDSVLAWIYFKNVIVLNQIPQVFELILIAFSFPVAVFVKQEGIYRTVNEPLHSASALTFFLSFFLYLFIYLFCHFLLLTFWAEWKEYAVVSYFSALFWYYLY